MQLPQFAKFGIRHYNALNIHMIKRVFPILALSIFSSMLGVGIIAPLLPLYAENLGATGIGIGIIFGGFSFSRAIFIPVFGRLSDRSGRKRLICIGLLLYAIISLGYIWADSVSQLTLVRLIQGAASGMILPIAQAYIGDIAPEGKEGTWMGYFNAAFFAGFGVGPLMGGILTDYFGMTTAFSAMGGLNLLAFLVAIIFLPASKLERTTASPATSFKEMSSSGIVKGIFSFRLVVALSRAIFATFVPIFAAFYIGLSPTLIGIILTANILLMSLVQVYTGNIADRFNWNALVFIGALISVSFLALVPLAHSFWQLLGLAALSSFGHALSLPAVLALTVGEGKKFGMGSTIAISQMAMSIGMALGPLLGGVIFDYLNVSSVFYFAAAIGLVGTGLFIWFTR